MLRLQAWKWVPWRSLSALSDAAARSARRSRGTGVEPASTTSGRGAATAGVAALRADGMFGPLASDPTISRLVDTLAAAGPRALAAVRQAPVST